MFFSFSKFVIFFPINIGKDIYRQLSFFLVYVRFKADSYLTYVTKQNWKKY